MPSLVTIPIKVMPATGDHSISFRQIHATDGGGIRYDKICEIEDRALDPDEIGHAYEASKDQLVPISDQELDDLSLPTIKALRARGVMLSTKSHVVGSDMGGRCPRIAIACLLLA